MSSVSANLAYSLPTADSPFDRIARRALEKRLAALRGGTLELADGMGTQSFGSRTEEGLSARLSVHHPRFYRRVATGGSLAAAEAYLDGDWSCDDLTALVRILIRNMHIADRMDGGLARWSAALRKAWHWLRRNTRSGSRRNIAAHYDLGNDFFHLFLDETMMYSSAIFEREDSTLYEASVAKLDCICQKLNLRPSDHLLEIGTGWGGFSLHAAANYGCRVTTTTISREQFELARRRIDAAGLSDRVTVLLRDYRDLEGTYDKLVSIEMVEAVGHEFLDEYFRRCGSLLKPDGLMLLQAIVMNEQRYAAYLRNVDFIQRYVFPGGCLPSVLALGQAAARTTDMRIVHLEDFAAHYARTLRCWRERFEGALDGVRELRYPERFIRLWTYYLCYCEAAFEERSTGVVQMLLARPTCRRDSIGGPPLAGCVNSPGDRHRTRPPVAGEIAP